MMKTYLVGGAVRDQLLHLPIKEKDWLVVGATPEIMTEKGFRPVGKDFPVFLHPDTHEEYALARTERKTAPGYQGFTFHADASVTLEQDLQRRDLTINAIAQDQDGVLYDPIHGQDDIVQRCLRHVSDAFIEDPVRILRVARFLARFHCLGFSVAQETMVLMQSMVVSGEAKSLVAERVWQECFKALQEKNPECFLDVLEKTQATADIFPEIPADIFSKIKERLAFVTQQTSSELLRFSALVFDLEMVTIEALCERMAVPTVFKDMALMLKIYHQSVMGSENLVAEEYALLLKKTDAIRKKDRFNVLIEGTFLMHKKQIDDNVRQQWEKACVAYNDINPQVFIQQGFEKAALGKAIAQKRIDNLHDMLKARL